MKEIPSSKSILFVQDSSPCIRTIKYATALQSRGYSIHLAHRNRTPDEAYGYGNASFETITCLPKYSLYEIKIIRELIAKLNIDILHYHNQPDRLGAKLIRANPGIPVIYDQHDFMSFKHHISGRDKKYEKICNENADGAVYITRSYKNEVAQYYSLIDNSLCFANYYPAAFTLKPDEELPKLSAMDGKCHIVYLGRISERRSDHRNIIDALQKLSAEGFAIHCYPSRNKEYLLYRKIPHVTIHNKLAYQQLIKEISQYDFGLTVFNNAVVSKLPHITYALGNKTFDYLCAGIPVLVQDCLVEVKNIVMKNGFGFILEHYEGYKNISQERYLKVVETIRGARHLFTMESQIQRVIDFYTATAEKFNAKA